ncbi:MurR/RpiR family transcriptional regulator [Neobittarella massiliensis]|uniref:MurPQ operon repressor n=1 Tax=uncultured Anaerotruncus sp. TaxID=905011 RepID=A0A1C6J5N4_9FIRM|nr:MurR/RpiR family transcriptional regulator [Neobittarella massiliensis]SCJ77457.1 MurPQ operon repressor [uncultured Anaerotruncus sp.]
MDYRERIQLNHTRFTKNDRQIADFIDHNPQAVEELTISRVAQLAGASISAVQRFCKKLGYSGYSEFRFDLIKTAHTQKPHEQLSLLSEQTSQYAAGVRALSQIPPQQIIDLIGCIQKAPFIKCLGSLASSLPAMKFYYDFTALGKRVLPLTGSLAPWVDASLSGDDLIIVFSTTGELAGPGMADFIDAAQKLGCEIVLVTCNRRSKLAQYATRLFLLPTLKMADQLTLESQSLMMMLVSIWANYAKQYL